MRCSLVVPAFVLAAAAARTAGAQGCWGTPIAKAGLAAAGGIGLWGAEGLVVLRPPGPVALRGSYQLIGMDDVAVEPTAWTVGVAFERPRGAGSLCAVVEVGRVSREDDVDHVHVTGTIARLGVGFSWTRGAPTGWRQTLHFIPQLNHLETRSERDFFFGLQTTTDRTLNLGLEAGIALHRRHGFVALAGGLVPFHAASPADSTRLLLRAGVLF